MCLFAPFTNTRPWNETADEIPHLLQRISALSLRNVAQARSAQTNRTRIYSPHGQTKENKMTIIYIEMKR
jgi:hypothetical protein